MSEPEIQKCHLCGKNCDENDRCPGCGALICNDCDEVPQMWRGHEPEDHGLSTEDE